MWKKINALLSNAVGGLEVFMCGCVRTCNPKGLFWFRFYFFSPLNCTPPFGYYKNCVKVTSRGRNEGAILCVIDATRDPQRRKQFIAFPVSRSCKVWEKSRWQEEKSTFVCYFRRFQQICLVEIVTFLDPFSIFCGCKFRRVSSDWVLFLPPWFSDWILYIWLTRSMDDILNSTKTSKSIVHWAIIFTIVTYFLNGNY